MYAKAAAQGLAPAQFELGACYERGFGVAADRAAAISWYRKAAAQVEKQAVAVLARLAAPAAVGPARDARS